MRVLAMCVANSARSQMAEGWLRALSVPSLEVWSAGSAPTSPRPEALAVMAEVGVDLRGHRSKTGAEVPVPDVVATLCAEEVCPVYPGDVERLDWGVPDPATVRGSLEERLDAFRAARDAIRAKVEAFLVARGLRHSFASARGDFLLDPTITFLNHGSFGATPRSVLEARHALAVRFEAEPVDYVRNVLPGAIRHAAERVAGWLGVPGDELGFVDNATAGTAMVLRSFDLGPGDVLLTTDHAYGAVRRLLDHVCDRTGARVHAVRVPFPVARAADVVQAVADDFPEGCKLAVFDHITSITGLVFPVAELVALCRERGVPTLIDGAHAPGQAVFDLAAIGADFWTGNLHKWAFAPKGCAVLHARPEWHDHVHPLAISHFYRQGFAKELDWQGTRDFATWLACEAGLDQAERWGGWDRIRVHNVDLRRAASDLLTRRLGLTDPIPAPMLAALQTFRHGPGTQAEADAISARLLRDHRIEAMFMAFGEDIWFRISPQLHNHLEQYERLASVLQGAGAGAGAAPGVG
ncbi:MAG: aminotransferase class V-fold PLP-dependent enzyme [Alphaproteobacteria bacterium]|nr:aminotransferase class V-fold PLP-dependent enzyme [Alphaproteobacteria bacterium]MCB9695476.1 aminotransferase class V-fold PLP-dependent enzyme [Alphaproteobacteria bacterium]